MEQHKKCSNQTWFDFSFVRHISGSSLCSYIRIFSRHFPDTITTGEQNRDDPDNSTIEPLEIGHASEISCTESDAVTQVVQGVHKGVDEASYDFNENGVHSTKKVRWSRDFCTDFDEPVETSKSEADNTDDLDDDFDHCEHDDIDFSRITSFYSAFSVLDHSGVCHEDTVEQATYRVNDTHRASIGDRFERKPPIDSDETNASVCINGSEGSGSVNFSDVDESGYFTETNCTTTPSFCLKSENPSKERSDKPLVIDANIEQNAETVGVTNSAKVNKVRNDFADRVIHFGKSLQTKNHFTNKQQWKADSRSASTTIEIRKPRSGIKNDIHHGPITDNGNSKRLTKSVRISPKLSESRMSKRSVQDKIRSLFQREHPLEVLFRQRKKVTQMNRRKRKPSLLSLLNCASGRL